MECDQWIWVAAALIGLLFLHLGLMITTTITEQPKKLKQRKKLQRRVQELLRLARLEHDCPCCCKSIGKERG